MFKTLLSILCLAISGSVLAQTALPAPAPKPKEKPSPYWCIDAGLGYHLTYGDMSQRYGGASYLNGSVRYQNSDKWFYGIDGGYFFGNELKEDPLAKLRTPDGNILGKDREYAFISMDERGFLIGAMVGKITSLTPKQTLSGLRTSLSVGYMQHQIRIQDDNLQVPALDEEYRKGYDRLTAGLQITEFIGYQIADKNGWWNFYGGIEATQGFTQSQRAWHTDLMINDTRTRFDGLVAARIGFTLALKQRKSEEIFY